MKNITIQEFDINESNIEEMVKSISALLSKDNYKVIGKIVLTKS